MNDYGDHEVQFVDLAGITKLGGLAGNKPSTLVTELRGDPTKLKFWVPDERRNISDRNATTIKYISELVGWNPDMFAGLGSPEAPMYFAFQGDDQPIDIYSASWQRKKDYRNVCLLPDFYYANQRGYRKFFEPGVPAWNARRLEFYWRGSTTGGFGITLETLPTLPRYEMCCIAAARRPITDIAFYHVVQTADEENHKKIEERLLAEDLLRPYCDMGEYVERKYILQVDGNGNSWELVRKLRLGCCLLIGDSDWQLWHDELLLPWKHFVPLKRDFSDLNRVIDWCLAHDAEASEIAAQGRAFAVSIDFEREMREAAGRLAAHIVGRGG